MAKTLLAWMTMLLLLAVPMAAADDDDRGERREGKGHDDEHKRELRLEVDDDKASIKLERRNAGFEDAVKIEFDASEAKIKVKHESESDGNETEQKLEARFRTLIEFVDANANGAYDRNETIASTWALGDDEHDDHDGANGSVEWGDVSVADVTSGNATGKKLSGRASFGPNATFGLDFYVYGAFTLVGNESLEPTEAKIDILIQRYPYVRNDSALAVIVDLKAKEEIESDREDEHEDGVSSEGSAGPLQFRMTFTWLENATVDGVDTPVRASVLKNHEESESSEKVQKARIALAYARGESILHDPTVGVQYGTQSSDARAVPAPALVAVGLAAAVATLLRRRDQA